MFVTEETKGNVLYGHLSSKYGIQYESCLIRPQGHISWPVQMLCGKLFSLQYWHFISVPIYSKGNNRSWEELALTM